MIVRLLRVYARIRDLFIHILRTYFN